MQTKTKTIITISIILVLSVLAISFYFISNNKMKSENEKNNQEKTVFEERPADLYPLVSSDDVIDKTNESEDVIRPRELTEQDIEKLTYTEKDRTKSAEFDESLYAVIEDLQRSNEKREVQGVIDINMSDSSIFLKEENSPEEFKVIISDKTEIVIKGKKIHFSDLKTGDIVLVKGVEVLDAESQIIADNIKVISPMPIIAF